MKDIDEKIGENKTDFIKHKNGKLAGVCINGNYYKKMEGGKFFSVNSLSYLKERNDK